MVLNKKLAKLITGAIASAMALGLGGCGSAGGNAANSSTSPATEATTDSEEASAQAEGSKEAAEGADESALSKSETASDNESGEESTIVSNSLFSITMPENLKGTYVTEVKDNTISIYDKEAKEANYGGFVFDVSLYKEPSEYAGGMDMKVGEFTASDGTLYDVVMGYPSDVQFDAEKYGVEMPKGYSALRDSADAIVQTLKSLDGSEAISWGAGARGKYLYDDILQKHVTAIEEGWDANKLEEENMSPMYAAMGTGDANKNVLDIAGYAYYDTNNDGIDELLIGEIGEGEWKGVIYDVYTMVDRAPAHVVSGWDRNRFYAVEFGTIVNEYSQGAAESGWRIYDIEPNTTNLLPQVQFKIDEYENKEQPYFASYDDGETWESLSKEDFDLRQQREYVRFDYTPLSDFKAGGSTASSNAAESEDAAGSEDAPESERNSLGIIENSEPDFNTEDYDTFTQVVDKALTEGEGYSNVTLGETDVLLFSTGTFGGYDFDAASDAGVLMYDKDGKIVYLGLLQAVGSATPLALKDGMIYTMGHHYAGKHTVKDGTLVTVEEAWETYDSDGSSTWHSIKDNSEIQGKDAEEAFNALFKEYDEAEIIAFDTIKK